MKQPRLRVQARHVGLIRDLDLGAEFDQMLDGASFRGAGVGRRDHAQPSAAFDECAQFRCDQAQPAPPDESNNQIDAVGRFDLAFQHRADPRLIPRIDEKIALSERDRGRRRTRLPQRIEAVDRREPLWRLGYEIVVIDGFWHR